MRSRISKRGCVCRSVGPSVGRSHTSWYPAKVLFSTKITSSTSVNASYAVHTALFKRWRPIPLITKSILTREERSAEDGIYNIEKRIFFLSFSRTMYASPAADRCIPLAVHHRLLLPSRTKIHSREISLRERMFMCHSTQGFFSRRSICIRSKSKMGYKSTPSAQPLAWLRNAHWAEFFNSCIALLFKFSFLGHLHVAELLKWGFSSV